MNINGLTYAGANLASIALGTGVVLGGSKIYSNVTGKPAGAPGSLAHITSNDNLSTKAKLSVLAEQGKEGLKDTFIRISYS